MGAWEGEQAVVRFAVAAHPLLPRTETDSIGEFDIRSDAKECAG